MGRIALIQSGGDSQQQMSVSSSTKNTHVNAGRAGLMTQGQSRKDSERSIVKMGKTTKELANMMSFYNKTAYMSVARTIGSS